MRTLVIGDIHGGLKALKQVLERAAISEDDILIFLGDYVDGWSQASETITYLIALNSSHKCIYLRGNHDQLFCDWLETQIHNPLWLQHGGQETINSYAQVDIDTRSAHREFLLALKNYHLDEKNRLYVHAGFTNLKGVDFEYFAKTFYWDRTLWELALSLDTGLERNDIRYPKRLTHYREIYIGHTPVTRIGKTAPVKAANVWNVDTGAAFKGTLSIIDADTKEVWQSDPVFKFYPNESGRN
jgi:serine/threonine protein phosphatase 1